MSDVCIFCKIASGEIPAEKIYENENFFSILDKNQDVKGHALVIPKKHFVNSLDLPVSLGQEFLDCIKETVIKTMGESKAEGFNIINNNGSVAGQIVMHLHYITFSLEKKATG